MSTKKPAPKKKRKCTACVICRSGRQFWTTQAQFWQWVREGVAVKLQDNPLTGTFTHEHEESIVVRHNTVLNLACPNHLSEALRSRRSALKAR